MNKDVLITLRSIQSVENDRSETELITQAEFTPLDDGGFQISYDESEATGFKGSRTVVQCHGNHKASICRSGTATSNLIMDSKKKQHCHYGTPYGDMMVGIFTHAIVNELNEDGGSLYMKYTIDINSSYISDNEIFLKIQPTFNVDGANK